MREPDIVNIGGDIRECPFCGSPGVIYESGCDGDDEIRYGVQCVSCGMGYIGDVLGYDDALRVWNRRGQKQP